MVTRSRSTLRQRLFASDRALARAVLWTFMIVFVAVATGLPDRRAGEIEFQTTSALARTGSLSFTAESSPEAAGLIALHQAGVPIFQRLMQPTSSGAYVASEEPGQALVALPFYWLGRLVAHFDPEREVRYAGHGFWRDSQSEYYAHLFVGLRNPLMGALTAWLITLIVLQLGLSRRWALLGGLSFGLTSFALAQARSTLSDVQAMCAIVAAVHMLLLLRSRVVIGARARVEHGLMMGALLALAVLTRFELVIACFVLWVVAGRILWRLDRKVFVALSLMASTGLIAIVWMNQARFGFAFGLDPSALAASVSAHPPHWSLLGFLVSPNKGLFFFAPFAVLVLWAPRFLEPGTQRFFLAVGSSIVLAILVPVLLLGAWHGGWTFGPRSVLPALPFLFVAATAVAAHTFHRPVWRAGIVALLMLGLVTNLPSMFVDHTTAEDLTLQAAAVEWPDLDEGARWDRIQWDWRYAAPFLYWRILRHRVAVGDERFGSQELFFSERDRPMTVDTELRSGMRHLAWANHRAEGGALWPLGVLMGLFALAAVRAGWRAAEG